MVRKRARSDEQTGLTDLPSSQEEVIFRYSSSKNSSEDMVSKSNGHTVSREEGANPSVDELFSGSELRGGHLVPAMATPVPRSSPPVLGSNRRSAPVKRRPAKRPDGGGTNGLMTVRLRANSFLVDSQPLKQILRYTFLIREPSNVSNTEKREIMDKLVQENYADAVPLHDGHKHIYSSVPLPQGQFTVKLLQGSKRRLEMEYAVVIKLDSQFDGRCFAEESNNQTFLKAMAVILRENPRSQRFYRTGKGFYSKQAEMNERNIGGGIFASRGFRQSLRETAQGLALHVGISVVPMYQSIDLVHYIQEIISCSETEPLSEKDIHNVETHLRGLRIITTHGHTRDLYRVRRLSSQTARDLSSEIPMVGMVDYFKQKYGLDIRYKLWPCVNVSRNQARPRYIPLEFCEICPGQSDHRSRSRSRELTRMQRPPLDKHVELINDIMVKPDGPRGGPFTKQFQITVGADMIHVTGRVLEPPLLKLGDGCHVRPRWDDRQWNLVKSHVFHGQRIEKWGLVTFSRSNGNKPRMRNKVEKFYHLLVRKSIDIGVYMNEKPLVCEYDDTSNFCVILQLRKVIQNIHRQTKGELQILICVMEKLPSYAYNNLKFVCDIEVGLLTQCCLLEHVSRCSYADEKKASQYLANLVMKINGKVGGSNVALHENLLCKSPGSLLGHSDPVMIIGAHVTQGLQNDSPSIAAIAAVVGSINWPDCNRYLVRIKFQRRDNINMAHQAGIIGKLGEMCEELLKDYVRLNKHLPGKIVYFRSGASKGYRTLLNGELGNVKKAIKQNKYGKPAISFILASRAKETRLFPLEDQPRTRSGNVIPGTVVDTNIVHPREYDFYLCSHYTHKGTAIPARYHVIWDENGFSSDELQKLVNNLCYTSATCTKPISVVTPIYYARLAARRGHQYASTQSGLLSSFELPEAIKDTMFFC